MKLYHDIQLQYIFDQIEMFHKVLSLVINQILKMYKKCNIYQHFWNGFYINMLGGGAGGATYWLLTGARVHAGVMVTVIVITIAPQTAWES